MAVVQVAEGLITTGERQIVIRPNRVPVVPRYGVIYTHGAGARADAMSTYANAHIRTQLIADAGITAVSGDYGGTQTWGNDTAMAAMTAAYNYLQTQPGVKPGKVAIIGGSMGGLNALVWAAANPTKVSAISIYIPVMSPSEIHDQNLVHGGVGYAQYVDMGYGGQGWVTATYRATKDPLYMAQQGAYKNLPIRIHYGLQDALCLPANPPAFKTAVGGNLVTINGVTGGHEEATELQIDRVAERDYILQYSV